MKQEEKLYEKFKKKQSTAEKEILSFLSETEKAPVISKESLVRNLNEKCNEELNELFETGDGKSGSYEKLIFQFHQLRDAKKNIVWHVRDDQDQKLAIRDTRKADARDERMKSGEIEAHKIQILNLARAAELMIKSSEEIIDKKLAILEVRDEVASYFGSLRKDLTKGDVNSLNGKLVNMMMNRFNIDEKESYRRLNIAKEYVGFDDKHYAVSTIYSVKGKEFVETDIGLTELTDKQREKLGESSANPSNIREEQWFQDLDKFRQDMVYMQKAKIADGKHVCPTQLRELPLIRNGYKKLVAEIVRDGRGQRKLTTLGNYTHSGTHYVESENEEERKKLMKILSDQQESYKKPGEMMVVCDLLSPTFLIKGDKRMSSALAQVERQDSVHINLSQNIARLVVPQKTDGINEILKYVLKNIDPKILGENPYMFSLVQYLKTGEVEGLKQFKKQEIPREIKKLDIPLEEKQILTIMSEIRELLDKSDVRDAENKRLQIASKFEQLSNKVRSYEEGRSSEKSGDFAEKRLFQGKILNFEMIMQCKSGKDRTGVVELHNLGMAISQSQSALDSEVEKIIASVGDMSASVLFPGMSQGGTSGCFGIKTDADTVFSQKVSAETKKGIILTSSTDNNFKYDKKEIKTEKKKLEPKQQSDPPRKKLLGRKIVSQLGKISSVKESAKGEKEKSEIKQEKSKFKEEKLSGKGKNPEKSKISAPSSKIFSPQSTPAKLNSSAKSSNSKRPISPA